MNQILPHTSQKPFLTWSDHKQAFILTDPEQRAILCEFAIRSTHNCRRLVNPELALPEIAETQQLHYGGRAERC